jgi:large subunit ribosomal protein L7/L12
MAKLSVEDMTEIIASKTSSEIGEIARALREKFGVNLPSPPTTPPTMQKQAETGIRASHQPIYSTPTKTEFDIVLTKISHKKIQTISEVRLVTGCGLKEAKDMVEAVPVTIKTNVGLVEAQLIQGRLEALGATVELK